MVWLTGGVGGEKEGMFTHGTRACVVELAIFLLGVSLPGVSLQYSYLSLCVGGDAATDGIFLAPAVRGLQSFLAMSQHF